MKFLLSTLAFCGGVAAAAQFTIVVGKDEVIGQSGVGFDPSSTATTSVGDVLHFTFEYLGTHRIRQGELGEACSPLAGGFDSGIVDVTNTSTFPSFEYTVTNLSEPLYFYDDYDVLCQQGAVFCANALDTCNTYKAAATSLGAEEGVSSYIRTNSSTIVSSTTAAANGTAAANATVVNSLASTYGVASSVASSDVAAASSIAASSGVSASASASASVSGSAVASATGSVGSASASATTTSGAQAIYPPMTILLTAMLIAWI